MNKLFANANYKRIAGVVVFAAGIVLFILSVHWTKEIASANTLSNNISNFFHHNPTWNPLIKFFGGEAQKEIDYYDTATLMIQIGGVALTALGAVMIVVYRKK